MKKIAIVGPLIEGGLLALGLRTQAQVDLFEIEGAGKKIFIPGEELSWIDAYHLLPLWQPRSVDLDKLSIDIICDASKFELPVFNFWWDIEFLYLLNHQKKLMEDALFKWNFNLSSQVSPINKEEIDLKILLNGALLKINLSKELHQSLNINWIQQCDVLDNLSIDNLNIGERSYDLILYIDQPQSSMEIDDLNQNIDGSRDSFFYTYVKNEYYFLKFKNNLNFNQIKNNKIYPELTKYPGISFFKMSLPDRCDLSYLHLILLSLRSNIHSFN